MKETDVSKSIEYMVIEVEGKASRLESEVQAAIEEGWVPLGGMNVAAAGGSDFGGVFGSWYYYQAMTRGARR